MGAGRVVEIGVELRHLFARDGVDLRIAEQVGLLRQGDDERLIGKIDRHERHLELLLGRRPAKGRPN